MHSSLIENTSPEDIMYVYGIRRSRYIITYGPNKYALAIPMKTPLCICTVCLRSLMLFRLTGKKLFPLIAISQAHRLLCPF